MTDRVSRNIVYNLVAQSLVLVLGFVAVRHVFRQLGEDALGIIYFTMTMNAVVGAVLELGISSTTVREVAARGDREPEYIRQLVRSASLIYWGLYVTLAALLYLFARPIAERWLIVTTLDTESAARAVWILGTATLAGLPRSLYFSILQGLQRQGLSNLIEVLFMGLQQVGIIAVLLAGGGFFPVIYWLAASYWIRLVIYLVASAGLLSWTSVLPGYFHEAVARNIRYSGSMALILAAATIQTQADRLFISMMLPIGALGYYSLAYSLTMYAPVLNRAVSAAVFPAFAALQATGDERILAEQYGKYQDFACASLVPCLAAVTFAVPPLFGYMFNAAIAALIVVPATLLAVGFYMNGALTLPYFVSLARGKPEITVRWTVGGLLVALPATYLLVMWLGLVGAALSWILYHVIAYVYAVPRMCRECLAMPACDWYKHMLSFFIAGWLTYLPVWLLMHWAGRGDVVSVVAAYTVGTAVFLAVAYRLVGVDVRLMLRRRWVSGWRHLWVPAPPPAH